MELGDQADLKTINTEMLEHICDGSKYHTSVK